ncbi:kinase-like domain-containing protein [Mucor lusitanicus]|uniref:Kinase-like domain-containing protein n=1 Tax=Mucor circinelloides f. lusitanicus TaxID=29924 RepID=A0A8H4BM81_MUCCL|nr:kinase-like domain-containing protein [Mucor lusitanicus]
MSRLVREISLMEALDHPNIVRLYETYETTDSMYLVMEYVEGYNLDEFLQQRGGKLPENQARDIFRQMAAAMDYCHSRWVVHRDLKAPNILLTRDLQVKIADFGLGNRYGRRRLKTICGSMLYYSPEIINGQGYTGPEVDCWCLGVSLYRMTVGEEPFHRANTVGDLRKDVTGGNFIIPNHLSAGLRNTIMKCMSVDKNKRTRVHLALKNDPWLSDDGKLPQIFTYGTTHTTATMATVITAATKEEELARLKKEKEKLKYQHLRDMEEEKRSKKFIKRTIVCHPKNPSIYFTSAIPHSPKPEDTYTNSEKQRHVFFQKVNELSHQIQLLPAQNTGNKSPIRHLLRKLKQPENHTSSSSSSTVHQQQQRNPIRKTSSNMSLSQIYQRVAKDQVHYYTFQLTPQTALRITGVAGESSSISMQQSQQDEITMMLIIRGICDIMGITYHRDKSDRLICVMALSDYINEKPKSFYKLKRRDSKMASSNQSLYTNNNNTETHDGSQASFSRSSAGLSDMNRSSQFVGGGSSRFSKFKKMTSHVLSSIFPYHSSTATTHVGSQSSQQSTHVSEEDGQDKKSGVAIFAIEIISLSKDLQNRVTAIKLSKIEGSSKVFRIACGWITGVIGQNITPAQLTDQFNHTLLNYDLNASAADLPSVTAPAAMMRKSPSQQRLNRPKSVITLTPVHAQQTSIQKSPTTAVPSTVTK